MATEILRGQTGLVNRCRRPVLGGNRAAELTCEQALAKRMGRIFDRSQRTVDDAS